SHIPHPDPLLSLLLLLSDDVCFCYTLQNRVNRVDNTTQHSLLRFVVSMAVSDAVVSNMTTVFVAVIACIKVYGFVCGRSFSGGFVVIVSTTVVGLILVATLTWDLSRKATYAFTRHHHNHAHEMCKGGICWHGVAVRSPASQVRFRLPQQIPYGAL
ncbi:uncharacterized protein LOC133315658, partial [Gastrolobium bilobum]|uniref:uncharacterized protein LOC133315658 n=1 Tax=Gastrolobium bilobum TaxID=150636 RepID=UPI002AB15EAC